MSHKSHGREPWGGFCFSNRIHFVLVGGKTLVLRVWRGRRNAESWFLGFHLVATLAGVVSPLVLQPFMADDKSGDVCTESNSTTINSTCMKVTPGNISEELLLETDTTNIHIAFVIMAMVLIIASILLFVMYCCFQSQLSFVSSPTKADSIGVSKGTRHLVAFLLAIHYVAYAFVKRLFPKYLLVFVVKELGWSKSSGSYLTSLYHTADTCGKILGLVLIRLAPFELYFFTQLIAYCVVMLAMIFLLSSGPIILYICVPLLAISVSNVTATSVIWTNKYIGLTGYVVSINTSAMKLGEVIAPMLAGYLMENVSSLSFLYLVLAGALCGLLILVVCQIVVLKCDTIL